MATYYDPRQDSTVFSVYSRAYRTREQEKEEEELEKSRKATMAKEVIGLAGRYDHYKRLKSMQETQMLLNQRDPESATGFKYRLDETPRKKGWKGWLKHRYRKPQDRVILEERSPEVIKKRAIENAKFEKEQLSQLSNPDFWHGTPKTEKELAQDLRRRAIENRAIDIDNKKYQESVFKSEKERLTNMPIEQAQLELGIVEPIKPQSPGMESVARTDEFGFSGKTPKYTETKWRDDWVAEQLKDYDFESPGVSESQLAGRISGSRQRLTPATDPFVDTALGARDEVGRAAVRLGNLENQKIDLLEQAQDDLASYQFKGGSRVSDVEGFTDPNEGLVPDTISPRVAYDRSYADEYMNKAIATDKIGSDTSDLTPPYRRTDPSIYGREAYEVQAINKGNFAIDTPQADLPESVRSTMGKELVDKAILEDTMDLPVYDSFGELIKARDAAEKGTGLYKGLQSQINELFKRGGGTYEGASKAFGTVDLGSDLRQVGEATEGLASAVEAVDAGEDIASATAETGGKSLPGLSEALAAKDLYSAWGGEGTQTDKVGATIETGADLASTYAIGSGNPYAMAAGGIYKAGKFAWDLLT